MSTTAVLASSGPFAPSLSDTHPPSVRYIGIEEELLLVDAETFTPVPASLDILGLAEGARAASHSLLEPEVKREQIEVVSPPLCTHDELLHAVRSGRAAADRAARRKGARAVALATAPVHCDSHIVPSTRFDRMSERFGVTMTEQLTCGFHVHVTIGSPDEGVAVLDRIRIWLPLLLALSANSPFWEGADSGYSSYRYQVWGRWPCTGPYDPFGSSAAYFATIQQILDADVSLDAGMVYFDARLSAHAPTVEVRIADVCLAAEDGVTLAVLIRALVDKAAAQWRDHVPATEMPTCLLRLASWRASRFGSSNNLLHPLTGAPEPAAVCMSALLRYVEGHFASAAEAAYVREGVARILHRGTGAAQQRYAAGQATLREVIAEAVTRTHRAAQL